MVSAGKSDVAPTAASLRHLARTSLARCGAAWDSAASEVIETRSPVTGTELFAVPSSSPNAADEAVEAADEAFTRWRSVPAPARGRVIKRFGQLVDQYRDDLAALIMIEVGKTRSEALGEVQEVVDICDFATGLSRQLDGRTIASERPEHRLMETWHPMGVVGVISAFNFPAAVWAWNAAIALVAGNTVVWKPAPATAMTAMACSALLTQAADEHGAPVLNHLVVGDARASMRLVDHARVPVISATGSERMGAAVAPRVAARFGRCILELGGNNAGVVTPSADLDLAARAIAFAAAGTAGQRCTTMRRVIVHEDVARSLVDRLEALYESFVVGNPFAESTLIGPLINRSAFQLLDGALEEAARSGGKLVTGGERVEVSGAPEAYFVRPALMTMPAQVDIVRQETFAPLLYVLTYRSLDEAIRIHNDVPQGLSSSIFTLDQREAELFLSATGSDCGIVNVNIGTSGAEIGGAFGGEKSTGGGREAGSDAWRSYMRRATNTINYSHELPLAQGVEFV